MYNPSFSRTRKELYVSIPCFNASFMLFLFFTDCDNSIISVDHSYPRHGWPQFLSYDLSLIFFIASRQTISPVP